MKKSIAIFFLLTFIITTLTAQKETKAEKAALTCLDKELKKAEISSDYFVEVMDTLSVLSKGFDIGSFEKKFKYQSANSRY